MQPPQLITNVKCDDVRVAIEALGFATHHRRALLLLAAKKAASAPRCPDKADVLVQLRVRDNDQRVCCAC